MVSPDSTQVSCKAPSPTTTSPSDEAVGDDARPDMVVVILVPAPHFGLAAQTCSGRGLHLDGGVEQGEKFVHVTRVVEEFDPPASYLGVLLRHRPDSIAQVEGSLFPRPGGFEALPAPSEADAVERQIIAGAAAHGVAGGAILLKDDEAVGLHIDARGGDLPGAERVPTDAREN